MSFIQPNYGDKRILVAEDNPVNRKVVLAMLAKLNLKADFAENGQAALELLAKQPYHLVLMDCQMPVLDGYEATRIHRARETVLENNRRIPIVALTADTTAAAHDACLIAGMDDFLSKPIDYDALSAVLTKWLISGQRNGKTTSAQTGYTPCKSPSSENGCWDESAVFKILEGDEELLIELIRLFIESAPEQLVKLKQALLQNDYCEIADTAHAIKSMAGNFYAESAKSLASRLEYHARHGEQAELAGITADLTAAVTQLISALQRRKRANP